MKAKSLFLLFIFAPGTFQIAAAQENSFFTWDLLWTGNYSKNIKTPEEDPVLAEDIFSGGTLYNRGNFSLGFSRFDSSLRFLATDKRLLPLEDDDGKAGFNPGLGIYHHGSGSRLLYGVTSEYGLPARINHVWLRGIPFMESRSPSSRDLKTEPAARDKSETYLHLGLPQNLLPGIDAFASLALDSEQNPAFGGGVGWNGPGTGLLLEGFYTQKELPARKASTWFSPSPPLPERDFNIYAIGLIFYSPHALFATDWAWSETFAWGEGVYGNFALRLGNKPWRFSLAGDGVGGRFSDRNGAVTGEGLRLGAKGERFWPRSGLLRFQGSLRSSALEGVFDRGTASIYFRPSAPTAAEKRSEAFPLRFTRASLSLNRDSRRPEKTTDTLSALAGFYFGPLSGSLFCSLHSFSFLEDESLFHFPAFETFDSFKLGGEIIWKPSLKKTGTLDLRTRLGYTTRAEKDPLWELSLSGSIRPGKWGRVGLKIASTDFPEKWNYALSWRFEGHGW